MHSTCQQGWLEPLNSRRIRIQGTALAVPPKLRLPIPRASTPLARNSAVRSLYHRCHPEKAQAFAHESLPTKDLRISEIA